jgi:hypothetical protein
VKTERYWMVEKRAFAGVFQRALHKSIISMSYLFERKHRPFQHNKSSQPSDDSDLDDDVLWNAGDKDKRTKRPRRMDSDSSQISNNSANTNISSSKNPPNVNNSIAIDIDDEECVVETKQLKPKSTTTNTTNTTQKKEMIDLAFDDELDANDPVLASAKALLNKVNASRTKLSSTATNTSTTISTTTASTGGNNHSTTSFYVPEVRSAAQRLAQAAQYSQQLQPPKPIKPITSSSNAPPPEKEGPILTAKVRLNGQREELIIMRVKDNFSVVSAYT